MRFVYAAALVQESDEVVVSFRDLPECLTSGADESDALEEAQDALEEAIAGRIDDDEPIPVPSDPQPGEYLVVVPADMAAKAALTLAFREQWSNQDCLCRAAEKGEKTVRRMLDPRHGTSASRINKALRRLGREIVVEVV